MKLPARPTKREQNLLIQAVEDETLIYDESRHQAFCLDPLASAIWQHADGTRTPAEIAVAATLKLALPVQEAAVLVGLTQLHRDGLLQPAAAEDTLLINTISRRTLMRKVGLGAAMTLPVIASVMAPRAAQAYSGCVDCTPSSRRRPPTE